MATMGASVFPFRITPLNNIQPFTYRDGMSHLQLLEKLRVYVNDNLRGEFNDELNRIITEFNDGMEVQEATFNTAFADFVTTVNESVMAINNRVGPEAVQHYTLTADDILEIDPTWPDNQHIMIDVLQDATGGRTLTLGTGINGPLELNSAPNSRTVFTLVPLSDGTWRIQENSFTWTNALAELAGKLDIDLAEETFLAKTDAATTYQTQAEHDADRTADQAVNLTKTAAAVLYPTKQTVIDGASPDRRVGVRGGKTAFLGDSYMSGIGATTTANRWTSRYAAFVGCVESNHAVSSSGWHNVGVGGASKISQQAANIPLDTDRVIVCAGINDASFTQSQIQTGVTAGISAIRTRVPDAEIVVLSSMWASGQPSNEMLMAEKYIRDALPTDIRYVEGGAWLRYRRPSLQDGTGHPTDEGHLLIARWVQAKLENTGPGGPIYGAFDRTGISWDEEITSISAGVGLAGGTIYDARPGKWRITGNLVLYGTSDGFIWVAVEGERIVQRGGLDSTMSHNIEWCEDVRHQGGDMYIEAGMTMNSPLHVLEVGTKVRADWLED